LFANGRAKGALWAHAVNPVPLWVNGGRCPTSTDPNHLCWDTTMYGHAPCDLRMIAIPWIDICLAARLPDQAGTTQLKEMDTANAWLGDTGTRQIASAATFTGNKLKACWFPNQYCANRWKEYMATGQIKDSIPPPAPYNLTGTFANNRITLKWDSDADMETGIKTFIIYRNNSVYRTLQYPNAPLTLFSAEKGFQRWDDGDQPDPSTAPAMTYTDSSAGDTVTYVYQVACVNWLNGSGPKSGTLTLKSGQVTAARAVPSTTAAASHASIFLCRNLGNGRIGIFPGVVDIYDIRGRLLKTVDTRGGDAVNIGTLVGSAKGNVVIVRNRVR
jgi:hypothetical protein